MTNCKTCNIQVTKSISGDLEYCGKCLLYNHINEANQSLINHLRGNKQK